MVIAVEKAPSRFMLTKNATRSTSSRSLRRRALVGRFWVLVGFIALWAVLTRTGVLDPEFLPYPTDVLAALIHSFGEPEVLTALATTGRTVLYAFVIGSSIGIALGWILGMSQVLQEAFLGPVNILMSTPKSIFLPIFLPIFGLGAATATAFGAFEASVYVVVNIVGGMLLVQRKHLRMATAFNATVWQQFRWVVLPASLPGLFGALWFGIKHAFTGVLIAELFISTSGIGSLIRLYTELSRTEEAFALILAVSIFMIVIGSLANLVEDRLMRSRTA